MTAQPQKQRRLKQQLNLLSAFLLNFFPCGKCEIILAGIVKFSATAGSEIK